MGVIGVSASWKPERLDWSLISRLLLHKLVLRIPFCVEWVVWYCLRSGTDIKQLLSHGIGFIVSRFNIITTTFNVFSSARNTDLNSMKMPRRQYRICTSMSADGDGTCCCKRCRVIGIDIKRGIQNVLRSGCKNNCSRRHHHAKKKRTTNDRDEFTGRRCHDYSGSLWRIGPMLTTFILSQYWGKNKKIKVIIFIIDLRS